MGKKRSPEEASPREAEYLKLVWDDLEASRRNGAKSRVSVPKRSFEAEYHDVVKYWQKEMKRSEEEIPWLDLAGLDDLPTLRFASQEQIALMRRVARKVYAEKGASADDGVEAFLVVRVNKGVVRALRAQARKRKAGFQVFLRGLLESGADSA